MVVARTTGWLWIAVAALTIAVDQLTKWWVLETLELGAATIPIIGDLLGLRLVFNAGAAMSFGSSATWVLTVVSALACGFIIWLLRRVTVKAWMVALALILGGAAGNLIDRLLRAPGVGQGHVVDFIDYNVFVGNVADIALFVGAAIVIVLNLRSVPMRRVAGATDPKLHIDEDIATTVDDQPTTERM